MANEHAPLLGMSLSQSQKQKHRLTANWYWHPHKRSSNNIAYFDDNEEEENGHAATATTGSSSPPPPTTSIVSSGRARLRRFLTSRWGHYAVIGLVAVDVAAIFGGFLTTIFKCEKDCGGGGVGGATDEQFDAALEVFEVVSLVISCAFLVELLASLWGFGWRYLTSWFHVLDATVIVASFVVDVGLKGVISEAGSIVIVLRLWRVIKIIEELSAGADEKMDGLNEHIERLLADNKELRRQLAAATASNADD